VLANIHGGLIRAGESDCLCVTCTDKCLRVPVCANTSVLYTCVCVCIHVCCKNVGPCLYVSLTGVLIRKSEAPGGCGWIVDFGTNLGRQFFSTGGPGNVCHLAFATLVAPSSPVALAPAAETAKSPMMLSIVRRVMSPISASAEAAGWAVREVPSSEEALRNLIGLSRNLKGMAPEVCLSVLQSVAVSCSGAVCCSCRATEGIRDDWFVSHKSRYFG